MSEEEAMRKWWEMRGEVKENLYTLANFSRQLEYPARAEAVHKLIELIEKIDDLEKKK